MNSAKNSPDLSVLYEDNHLLVVLKPAGMLVQGDITGDPSMLEIGKQWLVEKYQKPGNAWLGLVHRLDRPVAGVLVLAKSSKGASRLSKQFRERTVQKSYLAVVEGKVRPPTQMLEHHITKDKENRRACVSEKPASGAGIAKLSYRVLDTEAGKSLLEVSILTGRYHQIRAQLAFVGFPILGDKKYGSRVSVRGRKLALFAHQLQFTHPTLKHTLSFDAPPPDEWPWSLFEGTHALSLPHQD